MAKLNSSLIQSGVSPCPLAPFLRFLTFFLLLLSPRSVSMLFIVLLRNPELLLRPVLNSSNARPFTALFTLNILDPDVLDMELWGIEELPDMEFWRTEAVPDMALEL